MTDIKPPADLVRLKREFIQADAELAALSKTMPSGRAIIAGEATEDPADRARWNVLHDRLGTLVVNRHRIPRPSRHGRGRGPGDASFVGTMGTTHFSGRPMAAAPSGTGWAVRDERSSPRQRRRRRP